jgi:hypothetical protein
MSRLAFFGLLIATTTLAQAQTSITQDTIVWKVDSFRDTSSGDELNIGSEFTTFRKNAIEWSQQGGEFVMRFKVTGTQGNWPDLFQSGSFTYKVKYQGRAGFIRIRRPGPNDDISIALEFLNGGTNTMPFAFHVQQFSKR